MMTRFSHVFDRWILSLVAAVMFAVICFSFADFAQAQMGAARGKTHPGGSSNSSRNPSRHGGGGSVGVTIDVGKIINGLSKLPKKKKTVKKSRHTKRKKQAKKKRSPARVVIPETMENEIVLAFASDVPDELIDAVLKIYGLRRLADAVLPLIGKRIVRAFGSSELSPARARRLANDPRVEVSPNYVYTLSAPAGRSVSSSGAQYAVSKLGLPLAHEISRGAGVVIAVIDSGIKLSHPALKGVVLVQHDVLPGKRKIRDSHGTAVASIIAAQRGMVGVAPDAKLISVRAFAPATRGRPALGTSYGLAKALDLAFQEGAHIFNMSFAGPRDELFYSALKAASEAGIVLVAAAGNKGPKAPPAYPAAYEEVIAVTATDHKDRLYGHANRGDYVSIAAPGVDILVAQNSKGFGLMSGTSMAAAYVTGGIALLMQKAPGVPASKLVSLLAYSARDLGRQGKDPSFGHGLLDVYRAVTMDDDLVAGENDASLEEHAIAAGQR